MANGLVMLLRTIHLWFYLSAVISDSSFNFQIGARVKDNVQAFLLRVTIAGKTPIRLVEDRFVNVTTLMSTAFMSGRTLFYVLEQMYINEITLFQFGFENKFYYMLQNKNSLEYSFQVSFLPSQQFMIGVQYPTSKLEGALKYYICDPYGMPLRFLSNDTFDCTKRPWYKTAKSALSSHWAPPFLQVPFYIPVISFVTPIINYTFNGTRLGFVGATAANVQLSQISDFLRSSYLGTDINVFIVEKASMNLIANSLNATASLRHSDGTVVSDLVPTIYIY